jgi:hypothetical protein
MQICLFLCILIFVFFLTPSFSRISWCPIVSSYHLVSSLQLPYGLRRVMRPPIHNPTNPETSRTNVSEETPCTWRSWLAHTAPGPPQEFMVRDETRISLPAKPSLTRTTLGQLCVAPRTSRSRERTQNLWWHSP